MEQIGGVVARDGVVCALNKAVWGRALTPAPMFWDDGSESVGEGARAVAHVRATGRITCKRDAKDGSQRINVKMLSESSDEEFDARAIVVAMLQKACPFHEFRFVEV